MAVQIANESKFNEILLFKDQNMRVVVSLSKANKYGSISIGKGRSLNQETILHYASSSPMNGYMK